MNMSWCCGIIDKGVAHWDAKQENKWKIAIIVEKENNYQTQMAVYMENEN